MANVWLEGGGTTVAYPGDLAFQVSENTGGVLPYVMPVVDGYDFGVVVDNTADARLTGGIYNIEHKPLEGLTDKIYTLKADIAYHGKIYSAVASFSKGELSAIASTISGIQTAQTAQAAQVTTIQSGIAGQTTTLQSSITGLTTALASRIGTVETDMTAAVRKDLATQLAKGIQSGFLTRPGTVTTGTTVPIRYRTASGLAPKITVYDAGNVARVSAAPMAEISSTGIYEYRLTLDTAWGLGDFTVMTAESTKGSTDSLILNVVMGGLDEIYSRIVGGTAGGASLDRISADVTAIKTNTDRLNTDITGLLTRLGKTTDSEGADTLFGKIAAIDASGGDEEAVLAGIADIKNYVDTLEGSLGSSEDPTGDGTIFSRLTEMDGLMKSLGASPKRVGDAKARAKNLAKLMAEIRADLANGNMAEASAKLEALGLEMASLNKDMNELPATAGEESVGSAFEGLKEMAAGGGLEDLVPLLEEIRQGREAFNPENMAAMRNTVEELKSLMTEVRSLLDQEVNKPVVHGWLEEEQQ